jgi:hypothetical protein
MVYNGHNPLFVQNPLSKRRISKQLDTGQSSKTGENVSGEYIYIYTYIRLCRIYKCVCVCVARGDRRNCVIKTSILSIMEIP